MGDTFEDDADRACDWNAADGDTDIFGVPVGSVPEGRGILPSQWDDVEAMVVRVFALEHLDASVRDAAARLQAHNGDCEDLDQVREYLEQREREEALRR